MKINKNRRDKSILTTLLTIGFLGLSCPTIALPRSTSAATGQTFRLDGGPATYAFGVNERGDEYAPGNLRAAGGARRDSPSPFFTGSGVV